MTFLIVTVAWAAHTRYGVWPGFPSMREPVGAAHLAGVSTTASDKTPLSGCRVAALFQAEPLPAHHPSACSKPLLPPVRMATAELTAPGAVKGGGHVCRSGQSCHLTTA